MTTYKTKLANAENLLNDCKKYGTTQFAAVARLAFIGKILLNGLVDISKIDKQDTERFMNSISTPVSEFQSDLFNLKNKNTG